MEHLETEKFPSSVNEVPGRGQGLQAARERLNETWNGVNRRAHQAAQYTNQAVHDNPWTALGIGFGAGVVIGALLAYCALPRSWR